MSKKKRKDEEELEDDLEPIQEYIEESEPDPSDEMPETSIDDEDQIDIVIEISETEGIIDIVVEIEEGLPEDPVDEVILSKHKLQGKHSLKYDSIFKGKKDDLVEDDMSSMFFNENFEIDKSSVVYTESHDNEQYLRGKRVKEKVYDVLSRKTTLNFLNNRRKPSRVDFNNYYFLLTEELLNERFTHVELFNELSVYFSDNLFNMFKLLDNKCNNL